MPLPPHLRSSHPLHPAVDADSFRPLPREGRCRRHRAHRCAVCPSVGRGTMDGPATRPWRVSRPPRVGRGPLPVPSGGPPYPTQDGAHAPPRVRAVRDGRKLAACVPSMADGDRGGFVHHEHAESLGTDAAATSGQPREIVAILRTRRPTGFAGPGGIRRRRGTDVRPPARRPRTAPRSPPPFGSDVVSGPTRSPPRSSRRGMVRLEEEGFSTSEIIGFYELPIPGPR